MRIRIHEKIPVSLNTGFFLFFCSKIRFRKVLSVERGEGMRKHKTSQEHEEIIRTYADTVYRLAYSYTRNQADAEDVFQEVFLRYWKKKPEFRDSEHAKAWFLKVTANCAKSLLTMAWRKYVELSEQDIISVSRRKISLMMPSGNFPSITGRSFICITMRAIKRTKSPKSCTADRLPSGHSSPEQENCSRKSYRRNHYERNLSAYECADSAE